MEALVVIAVVAVLAAILVPTFSSVRAKSRATKCASKVAQISMAARMYYDDHRGPILNDLPVALADYVDSQDIFVCPEDRGSGDSYSEFFIARSNPTSEQFVVGCPRHRHGDTTVVGLGKCDTSTDRSLAVKWNGEDIGAGDTVTGGVMEFADGSTVTIQDEMTVGMLVSISNSGRAYSIVWVPEGSEGRIDCDITPGSAFEVVTPSAIAGVQGTKFSIYVYDDGTKCEAGADDCTYLEVYEGKVLLENRTKKAKKVVKKGQSASAHTKKDKSPNGPKTGNNGNAYGEDKDKDK